MLLHLLNFWILLFAPQPTIQQEVPVYSFEEFEPMLHRNTDTLYVVNFWATWCKPCVKELNYFDQLETKFKGKKIKVILVTLDFEENLEKQVKPFLLKKNIQSEVVMLDDPNSNEWIEKVDPSWSGSIPATVLYSQAGRSFYEKEFTENELNQLINKQLKNIH